MNVGVRELKAKLSEYVKRAEKGEVIVVTDRGEPRAVLGPVESRSRRDEGVEAGWIRPGNPNARLRKRQRVKARLTVRDVLDEDRGR